MTKKCYKQNQKATDKLGENICNICEKTNVTKT